MYVILILNKPYVGLVKYGKYYVSLVKIIKETNKAILVETPCVDINYGLPITWIPKSTIVKIIPLSNLL